MFETEPTEPAEPATKNPPTDESIPPFNEGAWRLFSREKDGTETHILSLGVGVCLVRSGGALAQVNVPTNHFFPPSKTTEGRTHPTKPPPQKR